MSLLGSYRKKPGSDGYESLQLVDSSAEGGGDKPGAIAAAGGRSPARQQQQQQPQQPRGECGSTMDSSGRGGAAATRVGCGANGGAVAVSFHRGQ